MNEAVFRLEEIKSKSECIKDVKKMADTSSSTLGFLPYGAFERLADKGNIIVCLNIQEGREKCVGYCLYDIGKGRVRLNHLCVNPDYRGMGIARILISKLKEKTEHLPGIIASCRRDYELEKMWESLGFIAISERPGRSKDGTLLTDWWLDYCKPNLLSHLQERLVENKVSAVIDANVFYDLADEENRDEYSKDSLALMADWLSSEVEFFITSEIKNEINRNSDPAQREKLRRISNRFTEIVCPQEEFEKYKDDIRHIFPTRMSSSDQSDLRQIARTIGSNTRIDFFVTKDKRLIENAEDEILEKYSIKLVDPVNLIIRIDELRREIAYQPVKLAGTSIEKKLVQSGDTEYLIESFLDYARGESKSQFRKQLREYLSNPEVNECFVIEKSSSSEPLALVILNKEQENELSIPIIRGRQNILSSIVIQHLIFDSIKQAVTENRNFICIREKYITKEIEDYLFENNFFFSENAWVKLNLKIANSANKVSTEILRLANSRHDSSRDFFANYANLLKESSSLENVELVGNIENAIFPGKIADAQLPNFIIPIKGWWAKDLFDEELAKSILWGADDSLALRREAVYYKSRRATGGLKFPGRILWYVSHSNEMQNTNVTLKAIRACSRLDEIIVDKPQKLYKKFKRLGVYKPDNLLRIAKGDPNNSIMAIRFSHTELFTKPVTLKQMREILGKQIQTRSPYKIDAESFRIIYNTGVLSE